MHAGDRVFKLGISGHLCIMKPFAINYGIEMKWKRCTESTIVQLVFHSPAQGSSA